jgi:hypothetical protein
VCSFKILTERALEIGAVLGQAVNEGYSLAFGTLTMRHTRDQSLKDLWDAAGRGWQRAISGKHWVAEKSAAGVEGWVRVWEVTTGRNGWHVHVHFVMVLKPGATAADLEGVVGPMFERWSRGLTASGLSAPRRVGQDWHLVAGAEASNELANYLFKLVESGDPVDQAAGLGRELTQTMPGRSRSDLATRPVWSLLDEASDGDADAMHRWLEWEKGSHNRRQVGWSQGLRKRFAPELVDVTDECIAAKDLGSSADDLVLITAAGWRRIIDVDGLCPSLLDATEGGGLVALCDLLDRHDVEYSIAHMPDDLLEEP